MDLGLVTRLTDDELIEYQGDLEETIEELENVQEYV